MQYEYTCDKCSCDFELKLKMAEMNLPCETSCPNCGELGTVRRAIRTANPFSMNPHVFGRVKADPEFRRKIDKINSLPGVDQNKPRLL